ncbi:MAG: YeeE/YedE family protein [Beijerinckiaceae bacterium]
MVELPAWAIPLAGLATGILVGYMVRRARLCTFGAIEDAVIGHDWRRMKIFGLALAVALALTQAMVLAGVFDTGRSTLAGPRLPWLSILAGSLLFGLGMALVGTCAFGSLIRLGGGDMRSFVVILVFSLAAYAVLRGSLAPLRISVLETVFINGPGGRQATFSDLLAYLTGRDLRFAAVAAIVLLFAGLALVDTRLWRTPRLLAAALTLGLGVAAGWFFTGVAVDPFDQHPSRVQSLTFVAPTARAILLIAAPETNGIDFGVASVAGVVAGAWLHAVINREFRWEAFDDDREMRRHIAGALLMGLGGILAGGCTIGQGLSGGSLLSLSWPLAVGGMIVGARLGLGLILEGSLREWLRNRYLLLSSFFEPRREKRE